MTFTLPRQACRCGEVFGTLKAHLTHADYCEPLPHDHPADVGLVQVDGEWVLKGSPVSTPSKPDTLTKSAAKPARTAHTGSTRGARVCKVDTCDNEFDLPNRRGRPPVYCPDHRSK